MQQPETTQQDSGARLLLNISLSKLPGTTVSLDDRATPCRFRLLNCNAFLDQSNLRIMEYATFPLTEHLYAAVSYPWRDLQPPENSMPPEGSFSVRGAEHADQISIDVLRTACLAARRHGMPLLWLDRLCLLQTSKQDKNWQIQRMFQIYKRCNICLIFPGGFVRLADLSEPTSWIDRAWTLQEAAANLTRDTLKCVFSFTQSSLQEYLQGLPEPAGSPAFIQFMCSGSTFVQILEPGHSGICDLMELFAAIFFTTSYFEANKLTYNDIPLRIVAAPAAALLKKGLHGNNFINHQNLWMSAFTRTSSRPVDTVFSVMGPMAVNLTVSEYGANDRLRATIHLIQALLKRGRKADWLFIAPELPPSSELSTLPTFPETSVSGRAFIRTHNGDISAFDAIGLKEPWKTDGAPQGVMPDSGYFTFRAKGALIVGRSSDAIPSKNGQWYECPAFNSVPLATQEVWAVVVGRRRESNRDPNTGQITLFDADKPFPKIQELTLMLIEKHGVQDGQALYHRLGMEHEIDEGKMGKWQWVERDFSVGGQGKGDRVRFGVSLQGPVYF